jgi:putative DNA primase/helicase
MNFDDLKPQKRWVCYKSVEDKAPMNPHTGKNAKSTDESTWATYDEAKAAVKRYRFGGVGIVLIPDDNIIGVDFDDCISDTKEGLVIHPMVSAWRSRMLHTYCEQSPSGTGLHLFGFAKIDHAFKRVIDGIGVEIYSQARYFTVSEIHIEDHAESIGDIQHVVDDMLAQLSNLAVKPKETPQKSTTLSDLPEKWVKTCWENWQSTALNHIDEAVDGDRHYARWRAAKLLGGAVAVTRAHGLDPISDDDAMRMLYQRREPSKGSQRKEFRVIEQGYYLGIANPLDMPQPEPLPPPMQPRYTDASINSTIAEFDVVPLDTAELMPKAYHHTDVGNGLRFADCYAGKVCYVSEWQQWMVWSGKRWERTDDVAMRRLAHDLVLTMYKDAVSDGKLDQELAKWAMKSESAARVNAMLDSAQPYLLVPSALFDAQHDVINVANGMIDLSTGDVRPHDPLAYHTKLIDINYDDEVSMEWWANFLITIFDGDVGLIDYMQRAIGYTLTGRTDEHCLFFCYGTGKNGKSTFMRALEMLMGSYSTVTSVEALLDASKPGESATPYMAKLPGMRLAMAQEMPEGRRFNESLVKSITGGDTISARDMYKSVFQFTPTHKLWITGNHLPRISGTDDGIWRRLRIVPFTVTIPEARRKDSRVIEEQLRMHLSGLLRWAVLGAQQWLKQGLGSCKAVDMATTTYRGEEDAVQRFITERCEVNTMASVSKGALFGAWREWVDDEGDRSMSYKSQRWLMRQLIGRFGCQAGGSGRTSLVGIRLIPDDVDHRAT